MTKKMIAILLPLFLGACSTTAPLREPSSTIKDLVEFEKGVKSENLFDYRSQTLRSQGVDGVIKHNKKLLTILSTAEAPAVTGSWKATLNEEETDELYYWLESHPVASSHNIMKYDPHSQIGFCFGRATAVHLEALGKPYKLHPNAIRKIWVVGPMHGGWGHHVATMVLSSTDLAGEAASFTVIDPVTGVVSAEEWIENIRANYQITEKDSLMYFVTEPSRFGPFPGRYTKMDLFGPDRGNRNTDAYRGYFDDLMKKFRVDRMTREPSSVDASNAEFVKAFTAEFESVPKVAESSSEGRDEVLVQMEFDFVKDL